MFRTFASLVIAMLAITGCGRDLSSTTYTDSATSGKVLEGTIISARQVTVKPHGKLSENTAGGLIGGATGAVAGAQMGNGRGNLAAAVGGAVIGAVAGALAEDALGTNEAMEYLVKIDPKYARKVDKNDTKHTRREIKNPSVSADINSSVSSDTQTDIVSVVQQGDPVFAEGAHVYIVYHDDRPRLVAAK